MSDPIATTSAALPTSTSSVPSPPTDGSERLLSHGFVWYLLVLLVELAALVGIAVLTRYTVQHRSGLNEPDKIRRIWARAPEIRFQPVLRPLTFAIITSFGAQTVLHALAIALFSLVGFNARHGSMLGFIVSYAALGFSSVISVLVYRATGGSKPKLCAAATLLFDWFMHGVILNWGLGMYVMDRLPPFTAFVAISATFFVLLAVMQVPFYIWAISMRIPATARLIYNNSVVPNWVKLDRTILMVAGPLIPVRLVSYYLEDSVSMYNYVSRVVSALGIIILLSSCALASIISVNRALLANEFQWQWRAFLTPAVPLVIADIVLAVFDTLRGKGYYVFQLYQIAHLFMSYGSSGALGAYVYLKLAETYAQAHIDEDVLAQDDLLAEFEEDEDNEELEV